MEKKDKNTIIATAKAHIEDRLKTKNLSLKDALIKEDIILLYPPIYTALVKNYETTKKKHPYLGELTLIDKKIIMRAKISSPNSAVQVESLANLGAKKILYVGIAGSISNDINIGDLVTSSGCFNETGTGILYGHDFEQLIEASNSYSNEVFNRFDDTLNKHLGTNWCTDSPNKETTEKINKYQKLGARCVDMETAGIFSVCQEYNIESTALFIISDKLTDDKWNQSWDKMPSLYLKVLNQLTSKK